MVNTGQQSIGGHDFSTAYSASNSQMSGGGGGGGGWGAAASGIGSAISQIASTYADALNRKNTYKFNARMSQIQGKMRRLAADVAIKNIRKRAKSFFSEQQAAYSNAGISLTEGSPLAVMLETQKNFELDEIYTNINADYDIGMGEVQQDMYRSAGRSAMRNAYTDIGTTILNTGVKQYTRG